MSAKISLQLYSIRDAAQSNTSAALKEVRSMGYDFVELAGTYNLAIPKFRELLDNTELCAISAHVPFDAFSSNPEKAVLSYKQLGCEILAIPYLPLELLPGGIRYGEAKEAIMSAIEACNKHDVILAYHNHHHEFQETTDGRYILDAFLEDIPDIAVQLDSGWITAAGLDPAKYMRTYSERLVSAHLKDTEAVGGRYEDRPVGSGSQDIPGIIRTAVECGADIFVVELDKPVGMTTFEAARKSREYLKAIGY